MRKAHKRDDVSHTRRFAQPMSTCRKLITQSHSRRRRPAASFLNQQEVGESHLRPLLPSNYKKEIVGPALNCNCPYLKLRKASEGTLGDRAEQIANAGYPYPAPIKILACFHLLLFTLEHFRFRALYTRGKAAPKGPGLTGKNSRHTETN